MPYEIIHDPPFFFFVLLRFISAPIHSYSEELMECLPPQESPDFPSSHPIQETTASIIYKASVLHTDSFKEMIGITSSMDCELAHVLRPHPDHVHNALRRSKSNSLSNLISSYFKYSQETTSLCLTLRRSIATARRLYCPIRELLHDLPLDSLTQSQCDLIFQEFGKFNEEANPFPCPNSQSFDEIRDLYSDLKQKLERRLRKSSSRIRFVRPPICCGGNGNDAVMAYIPPRFARRELAYAAQLKVASRNTYVLKADLDTLYSVVERLHNTVEKDKGSVQFGLRVGNDINSVQEVLKELGWNQQNLGHNLDLLEQKITTSFVTVNRSRSQLFEAILLHQTSAESSHSQ